MSLLVEGGQTEGNFQWAKWFLLVLRAWSLLDVLLWLVVLLGQVFSRGLAGDLDERQLFVVAGHIARRLAHAEVIVSLHQKICSGQRNLCKTPHWLWPKTVGPSSVKCEHVGLLNASANKAFRSHLELGEHILCTAPGCSRAHRLGRKKHTFTWILEVCTVATLGPAHAKVSYRACAPCGSCSCPSGSAFRNQCDRRWCCNCRRSPNPWPWPCSLPRVEADKSAATRTSHIKNNAGCQETKSVSY